MSILGWSRRRGRALVKRLNPSIAGDEFVVMADEDPPKEWIPDGRFDRQGWWHNLESGTTWRWGSYITNWEDMTKIIWFEGKLAGYIRTIRDITGYPPIKFRDKWGNSWDGMSI
jgi:hypothetical protein